MADPGSSAPHLAAASTRSDLIACGTQPDLLEGAAAVAGRRLVAGADDAAEAGITECSPGRWRLAVARDELRHAVAGRAVYRREDGERVVLEAGTVAVLPAGWRGECAVEATLRTTYMRTAVRAQPLPAAPLAPTPLLRQPLAATELVDWGLVPTLLEGASRTSGRLLYRAADGRSECGLWRCTPGRWNCHVTSDEFCHFLTGRCTYVAAAGEIIEIEPDTAAFFPRGWRGVCTVHATVTKIYMIR